MTVATEVVDYARLPEAELVALAKAGRREAFAAIMKRGNQRLFRIARAVVRDEGEAEDVLQEAYVRAFTRLADFRGEASIYTWLTRIVLNEAHGRLRKRRDTVDLAALEAAQADTGRILMFPSAFGSGDPERDAARAEARRLLERAVDDLPEAFRLVFVMRDIEECSIEETARNLDVRPETVKTRLHRARRLLRKSLDDQLSGALTGAFPFLGARCDRITAGVLQRMRL
ncbi:MAG TPA: RNA polymerase sigma factor [Phenylobacterium sp.]|uniref:RNA polymerase sigma factor n=1 Tax=Phenylobacterium sp. TaxID=1871053 RepID=UPI002C96F218|nr:RNA polymerase sigma factor [Phenylobacterium sp.]HSV04499.1 RNA polymerase sigma factor [Phenylobacterium sp.]